MTCERLLVAGAGNIFFGDDGFGVEVAQRLARRPRSPSVVFMDAGIRSVDLALELTDGYAGFILVDAARRGGAPGTLYVIEPDLEGLSNHDAWIESAHSATPNQIFARACTIGACASWIRVVGCEPCSVGDEEPRMGLSAAVAAAVEPAVALVESLVDEFLERRRTDA